MRHWLRTPLLSAALGRSAWPALLLAALSMAACGSSTTPSPGAPGASARTGADGDIVISNSMGQEVVSVSTGAVVGAIGDSGSDATGTSVNRIWATQNTALTFFSASGKAQHQDSYTGGGVSTEPVFAANGEQWAWSVAATSASGQTTVYVGTQAKQEAVLATYPEPQAGMKLTPVGWGNDTLYLTEMQVDGTPPISNARGVWSLNPRTGAITQIQPLACSLQAVSDNGSLLCASSSADTSLTVIRQGGQRSTLKLPGRALYTYGGEFSPNGNEVVLRASVSQGVASPGSPPDVILVGPSSGGKLTEPAPDTATSFDGFLANNDLVYCVVGASLAERCTVGAGTSAPKTVALPSGYQATAILENPGT